jgi:enoyl-CoA hydratase/carnithine racemase
MMTDAEDPVLAVRRGPAWHIELNRPRALNALNHAVLVSLAEAVQTFHEDPALRVLLLSGSDCGAFCVGGDLMAFEEDPFPGEAWSPYGADDLRCYELLSNSPKPAIAVIDGHCLGGGFELALACDIRVATLASGFALPEPRVGLVPEFGLDVLSRLIPKGEASLLQLTGRTMTAQRAYDIGLVQAVAATRDDVFSIAQELTREICANPSAAVEVIKAALSAGAELPLAEAQRSSRPARHEINHSAQARERVRAFLEARNNLG